jgi:hypothetical protein
VGPGVADSSAALVAEVLEPDNKGPEIGVERLAPGVREPDTDGLEVGTETGGTGINGPAIGGSIVGPLVGGLNTRVSNSRNISTCRR